MLRIPFPAPQKRKGGQYAPDFATYFATFKGVSICRIVTQNRCEIQKKTNESTEAKGSAYSGLSKLSNSSLYCESPTFRLPDPMLVSI